MEFHIVNDLRLWYILNMNAYESTPEAEDEDRNVLAQRIDTLDSVVHNLQQTIEELRGRLQRKIDEPDQTLLAGNSPPSRDSLLEEQALPKDPIPREMQLAYEQDTSRYSKLVLPTPLSVCYAILDCCDRHCLHCMSASNERSDTGLPTSQVQSLFEIFKEAGVLRIDIVGGEPFLRDDLFTLLRYAAQLGLEVTVTTHGGLITESHAKTLASLGIIVQVSLDGPRAANDRLRGQGSFDAAIRGIRLLVSHSIPTRISCTIQQANFGVLGDMLKLAKEEHVKGIYVNPVCAQGRADLLRDDICLNREQEFALRQQVAEYSMQSTDNAKLLEMKKAGRAAVFISASGDYVSQGWAEEDCVRLGNVFTDSIREMWQRTNIDHAVHLMQYLQHPLVYK
ncbi:hypothetical protein COU80_01995 [Candidatus Peregrinibacteria bacterium CG10_big_fil_rev_8_21_14_0_10_55_24]|nr:MAG: hypothetical protein COU80_01995 [Candidatus Peregrinibacteria bacterium CG10_big_fil_rev_8_21_14_0_10_55_24]